MSSKLFHASSGSRTGTNSLGGKNSGSVVTSFGRALVDCASTEGPGIGADSATTTGTGSTAATGRSAATAMGAGAATGTGSANCEKVRAMIVRSESLSAGEADWRSSEADSLDLLKFFMPSENSKPRSGLSREVVSAGFASHPRCGATPGAGVAAATGAASS